MRRIFALLIRQGLFAQAQRGCRRGPETGYARLAVFDLEP